MAELLYPISVLIMLLVLAVLAFFSFRYLKNGSTKAFRGKTINIIDRQYLGDGKMIISFLSGNTLVVAAFTSHGTAKLLEKELSKEEAKELLSPKAQGPLGNEGFSFKLAFKNAMAKTKGESKND